MIFSTSQNLGVGVYVIYETITRVQVLGIMEHLLTVVFLQIMYGLYTITVGGGGVTGPA